MKDAWVIMGTTGEYSDRSEWSVAVVYSVKDAESYIAALSKQQQSIPQEWRQNSWDYEAQIQERMTLDPYYSEDYTGTSYYYAAAKSYQPAELINLLANA